MTTRCLRCGRPLTDPKSVMRGYGPVCFGKLFGKKRRLGADRKDQKQIQIPKTPVAEEKQILHKCSMCGMIWLSPEKNSTCFSCKSTSVREIKAAPEPPPLKGTYIFQYKDYDPQKVVGVIETFDGSKWWLFENTGNNIYYCFARLSGMEEYAEFGYTNIDELWDSQPRNMIWYVLERDLPSTDYVKKEIEMVA